ncbi:MAG: hypothetical protein SGARI_008223 [Bacillariaceae sp.]
MALATLLSRLHLLAKQLENGDGGGVRDNNHQQNNDDDMETLKDDIRRQLKQDDHVDLWKAFFYRGNDQSYGAPTIPWGPEVLGWTTTAADADENDNDNSPFQLLPPNDFYLWLQDSCFFDADISSVIDEVVEPCLEEMAASGEEETNHYS